MAENKALLIITDGLGFDYERQFEIAREAAAHPDIATDLKRRVESVLAREPTANLDFEQTLAHALFPIKAEAIPASASGAAAQSALACLNAIQRELEQTDLARKASELIKKIARARKYAPWSDYNAATARLRNEHLTLPTLTSGKWAGFEDVTPTVSGNSETGHQQIGSLAMAPQTSLRITQAIESGAFYKNPALTKSVQYALQNGRNINIAFLLSGRRGDDGMVHSNWKHLEATLKLLYEVHRTPPSQTRILAILDGRDSPSASSVNKDARGLGGYLPALKALLQKYDAVAALAWVVGRNIGMDRDYQEHNAKRLWDLLANGEGEVATDFDALIARVRALHASGLTDPEIAPFIVKTHASAAPRALQRGDVFINLNFRSDRQKSASATLLGAKKFLQEEASVRQRVWKLDWLNRDLELRHCSITEYDPRLNTMPRASVAFPIEPLKHSFLTAYSKAARADKYMLVGESIKSAHVGYFLRGCRETPHDPDKEIRRIFSSFSAADGVNNDSQVYLKPAMQMRQIADCVADCISAPRAAVNLIICNLAAPDMVGHLLPQRWDATVEALRHTERRVNEMFAVALANGWHVVWTSDHGNIEENLPSHTSNDVLTTFAAPRRRLNLTRGGEFNMRLYDISYNIARILNLESEIDRLLDGKTGWQRPKALFEK